MIKNEDLFYCYSKKLSTFIYKESDGRIIPLTIAVNPKSKRLFSLYPKSSHILAILDKYKVENS